MVLEPAEFARVLPRAEEEVARIDADVPETVRLKAAVLDAEESRLANFLDFVGEGRGSNALAAGLIETESGGSRYCGPRWIRSGRRAIGCSPRLPPSGVPFDSGACRHRSSVRPKSQPRRSDDGSVRSGWIRWFPIVGRPCHRALTAIDALALLEAPDPSDRNPGGSGSGGTGGTRHAGTNSLRWCRQ